MGSSETTSVQHRWTLSQDQTRQWDITACEKVVNVSNADLPACSVFCVRSDGITCVTGDGLTCVRGDGLTCVTGDGLNCVRSDGLTCVRSDGLTCVWSDGFTCVTSDWLTCVTSDGLTCVTGDELTWLLILNTVIYSSSPFKFSLLWVHLMELYWCEK